MTADHFSATYAEARDRFRQSSQRSGAALTSYPVGDDQHTIDVATLGPAGAAAAVVLSSGVHGVEGFLGSAIQSAWLEQAGSDLPAGIRVVLVHAVNPFGFAKVRRCNEDNVDLNRNFHGDSSGYRGSPQRYRHLDPLLNPAGPARRLDTFKLLAIGNVIRHGLPALKEAIAGGQYDFPNGLFFGGRGPCESTRVVQSNIADWIGAAQDIVHVDFHSGLGKFSECRLMLVQADDDPDCQWYRSTYGAARIAPLAAADGFTYVACGAMGTWLRSHCSDRRYRFVTAEFGTHAPLRVLGALRRENQVHFYNKATDRAYQLAKRELRECFCPENARWRNRVVETGLDIVSRSIHSSDRNEP